MDYSKISSVKLYLMRSQDPNGIDAELDRRNNQAAKKISRNCRTLKYKMVDYDREKNQ